MQFSQKVDLSILYNAIKQGLSPVAVDNLYGLSSDDGFVNLFHIFENYESALACANVDSIEAMDSHSILLQEQAFAALRRVKDALRAMYARGFTPSSISSAKSGLIGVDPLDDEDIAESVDEVPFQGFLSTSCPDHSIVISEKEGDSEFEVEHTMYTSTYKPLKFLGNKRHNGQMKLLVSEVEFLNTVDVTKVIYLGSSPGFHLVTLSKLFPHITFFLYDKRPVACWSSNMVPLTNSELYAPGFGNDAAVILDVFDDEITGDWQAWKDAYSYWYDVCRELDPVAISMKYFVLFGAPSAFRIPDSRFRYQYCTSDNNTELREWAYRPHSGWPNLVPIKVSLLDGPNAYYNQVVRRRICPKSLWNGCPCYDCYHVGRILYSHCHINHIDINDFRTSLSYVMNKPSAMAIAYNAVLKLCYSDAGTFVAGVPLAPTNLHTKAGNIIYEFDGEDMIFGKLLSSSGALAMFFQYTDWRGSTMTEITASKELRSSRVINPILYSARKMNFDGSRVNFFSPKIDAIYSGSKLISVIYFDLDSHKVISDEGTALAIKCPCGNPSCFETMLDWGETEFHFPIRMTDDDWSVTNCQIVPIGVFVSILTASGIYLDNIDIGFKCGVEYTDFLVT
jgi:hypothetical protein